MMRIGHSTDLHRLKAGKSLILGGIRIDSPVESVGHSDADCLLHSVSEALLGALALGDLGTHFPDTDDKHKGMDSAAIVRYVKQLVDEKRYCIHNIDCMVFLERPKLAPYILRVRESIALLLDIGVGQVSVKATTGEKIGLVGTGQAIVCETVVLVSERERLDG